MSATPKELYVGIHKDGSYCLETPPNVEPSCRLHCSEGGIVGMIPVVPAEPVVAWRVTYASGYSFLTDDVDKVRVVSGGDVTVERLVCVSAGAEDAEG